jgi:hypothetical protein
MTPGTEERERTGGVASSRVYSHNVERMKCS